MTDATLNRTRSEPAASARGELPLWIVVALTAVPLVVLCGSERLGYDAFWHVFIARQVRWTHLLEEIRDNAHPPVFYLGLKATIAVLGYSVPVYRLISMIATLGSTLLVGRIVQRTARHPWLPPVAALLFGSSLTTLSIGLDVRSYALSTLFTLWALLAFLTLAQGAFAEPRHGPRVIFALMTSLAVMTHYVASLFLVGCCATTVVLVLLDRDYRRRLLGAGRRRWWANLLTFGIPAAVLATGYSLHFGSNPKRFQFHHIGEFLFDPQREGAFEFLRRGTAGLFELFLPALDYPRFASTAMVTGPSPSGPSLAVLVVLSLAAIGWLVVTSVRADDARAVARRAPPILLLAIASLLAVLGLLGSYPYGGKLRHQFVLFPFAVIALTLLIDEIAARLGRRRGTLAVCLLVLASLLNAANWIAHFRNVRRYLFESEMARFDQAFSSAKVLYVGQFNLINLFTHHHEQQWRFERRVPGRVKVDLWRVGDGGPDGFLVCRDRRQWQLDLTRPATFAGVANCLDAAGGEPVMVFQPQQLRVDAAWPPERTQEMTAAAAAAGLIPARVVVDGEDFYASFDRP